jgi:curli production assembly/transport component CsgE
MILLQANLAGLLLLASFTAAFAEPKQAAKSSRGDDRALQEVYGGIVANQTITVAGQDFYQHFAALWRDQDVSARYAISIHERPSARWGSVVWIEYAQQRVFQAQLPSARDRIKGLSEQAVETAFQKIVDAQVQQLFFRDTDFGPDEF